MTLKKHQNVKKFGKKFQIFWLISLTIFWPDSSKFGPKKGRFYMILAKVGQSGP